mgnify:CR=1 FL=1
MWMVNVPLKLKEILLGQKAEEIKRGASKMTKQIKVSDKAYTTIIERKAQLMTKTKKNVSITDTVDDLLKI